MQIENASSTTFVRQHRCRTCFCFELTHALQTLSRKHLDREHVCVRKQENSPLSRLWFCHPKQSSLIEITALCSVVAIDNVETSVEFELFYLFKPIGRLNSAVDSDRSYESCDQMTSAENESDFFVKAP